MAWIFLIIVAIVALFGAVQVPKRTLIDLEMVLALNGLPAIKGRVSLSGWPQMDNLDWCYQDCVITGLAPFIVVTNNFLDFDRAIRHKLMLEIAGAVLVKWKRNRVRFVKAERIPIPCDADENRLEDYIDSW